MVRIIADSTTDLTESVRERVTVIPLTIRFGDEEYIDGVNITKKEFYEKLIESDTLPKTSQATPEQFEKIFKEVKEAGDTAVVITLSAKLSGTCQSANIAAADYEDSVFVVDSNSVTIGTAILVDYALTLAERGMEARDIALELLAKRDDIRLVAMLDTLEYLKKGGRISAATAFAGGLLMIKPVICVEDGEVKMLGKARGSKQANNLLVEEIGKAGGVDFDMPVLLGYTGLSDILLKKYIEDSERLWKHAKEELSTLQIGSVIGTHAGPGAVAAAFFSKNQL